MNLVVMGIEAVNHRTEFQRLSSFYFCYFAALGAFVPYRGRYFDAQGFDSFTIGAAMALMSLVTVLLPYCWAWIADRYQRAQTVLLVGCLASTLATGLAFFQHKAWALMLCIALYSVFWNAIGPQLENLTLSRSSGSGGDYSRIRLWGSIGYIVTVMAVGYGIQLASVNVVVPFTLAFMLMLFVSGCFLPSVPMTLRTAYSGERMSYTVRQPAVLALFAACFLVTMSHAPYYTFFDLFLRGHGYGAAASGWLITLGVIAEIVLFFMAKRLLEQTDFSRLFACALMLAALRWVLLSSFPDVLWVLIIVQLLHAISFALMHSMAMHFLHHAFPVHQRSRAQALYGAVAYGAGGTIGNLISGALWHGGEGGNSVFLMGACYCSLAAVIVFHQRDAISLLMHGPQKPLDFAEAQ